MRKFIFIVSILFAILSCNHNVVRCPECGSKEVVSKKVWDRTIFQCKSCTYYWQE